MKCSFLSAAFLFVSVVTMSHSAQAQSVSATSATATQKDFAPWPKIMEKDILWHKRIWRDVPVADKKQTALVNNSDNDFSLVDVLLKEAKSGNIKLYSSTTNDFSKETTFEEVKTFISQLPLARTITDDATGSTYHECLSSEHLNEAIVKFVVKEDWLSIKDDKKVTVRILGIAPVVFIANNDGTISEQTLFWAYYPDNRAILNQYTVPGQKISWDTFFESRKFSGEITQMKEW